MLWCLHILTQFFPISDIKENVWIWNNEDAAALYMDKGEIIRFKVENEKFTDDTPLNPSVYMAAKAAAESSAAAAAAGGEASGVEGALGDAMANAALAKEPPYQIHVCAISPLPAIRLSSCFDAIDHSH